MQSLREPVCQDTDEWTGERSHGRPNENNMFIVFMFIVTNAPALIQFKTFIYGFMKENLSKNYDHDVRADNEFLVQRKQNYIYVM